jgi:AraC-like DNA-binding protein
MSRSSFAERFAAYLGRWRLQLAARMLSGDAVSVGQAASAVGYRSEAAFNRAFRREVGEAPGAWRRGRRPAATPRP